MTVVALRRPSTPEKVLSSASAAAAAAVATDARPSSSVAVNQTFLEDVIEGLSKPSKELQCKYFYDERGSQLFDEICELDEYYLTRTEQHIMNTYAADMATQLGSGVKLVEFGSGSSTKTQVLLQNLLDPAAYVPLDISEEHLLKTAAKLRTMFPTMEILPVVADFTEGFTLPASTKPTSHSAVYFPGSTIGNFLPSQASVLMSSIADLLGPQGGLLLGIDLRKDPAIIHAAYNDAKGVTSAFNLNILHRINKELGANFAVDKFEHLSHYNEERGRVESFVVSKVAQTVTIVGGGGRDDDDHVFDFAEGEAIFTEYSHKYTVESFAALAAQSGFSLHKHWTDENKMFAVMHLVNDGKATVDNNNNNLE